MTSSIVGSRRQDLAPSRPIARNPRGGEPFNLPEVWLDARVLELPDGPDHQQRAPPKIVSLTLSPHMVELVWRGRYEQLEHVLPVLSLEVFGKAPQPGGLALVRPRGRMSRAFSLS